VKQGLRPTQRKLPNNSVNASKHLWIQQLAAGLLLTSGIALFATFLHTLPGLGLFSPLILAILLGILIKNTVGTPQICQLGVTFSLKRILKFAIILLGLQLSLQQVVEVGPAGLSTALH